MIINRKIVMTTVMIENVLQLVHLESQSNPPPVVLFVRRSSFNINQVTAVQIVDILLELMMSSMTSSSPISMDTVLHSWYIHT